MAGTIIETKALTKRYGALTAVDDLNLTVRQGEVFGLLGPNGAGKTTTTLMLLGLTDTLEAVYPTVLVSYTVGVVVSLATSKKTHGLAKE